MRPRPSLVSLAAAAFVACGPVSSLPARHGEGGAGGGPGPDLAVDPQADLDDDGFTPAMGDCNDQDPRTNPSASEICGDLIDQNCDGKGDESCDNDRDGYALERGDCLDSNPLVNPGAVEVFGNQLDDDCDGRTDEIPSACDQVAGREAGELAGAAELCAPWVLSTTLNAAADIRARAVLRDFGTYRPRWGRNFAVLSTGVAADANEPGFVLPQPGTLFENEAQNPAPMANQNGCGMGPDEETVHDYVEWTLVLKVPTNARSFSFDFMFVSAEYPEYVCSQYNDKFLALLTSRSFTGNISFDARGKPVTVNVGFFDVCQSTMSNTCSKPVARLQGTGYERFDFMNRPIGGGTDSLHTTSPVTPGETATLRFILFDEGDHKFDSTVIIDNFQFQIEAAMGPSTVG